MTESPSPSSSIIHGVPGNVRRQTIDAAIDAFITARAGHPELLLGASSAAPSRATTARHTDSSQDHSPAMMSVVHDQ